MGSPSSHAELYRGHKLLFLLLALCGPAALLFLRITLSFAAERSKSASSSAWLNGLGLVALIAFFAAQLWAAWYMRVLIPARPQAWAQALQFIAVFLIGLLFSIVGAVMLEAFGYSLFIHATS